MAGIKQKNKEDWVVELLTKSFKNEIRKNQRLSKLIEVNDHVNVLKDVTTLWKEDRFKLVFGDAEQDIVFYDKRYRIDIPWDKNNLVHAFKSFTEKSKKKNKFPYIVIPYYILEVKTSKQVNTHTISLYSSYAEQIKDKFPAVTYDILLINARKLSETVERQGKKFDWIIRPKNIDLKTKEIEKFADRLFKKRIEPDLTRRF